MIIQFYLYMFCILIMFLLCFPLLKTFMGKKGYTVAMALNNLYRQ
jgi:hypothetical protein